MEIISNINIQTLNAVASLSLIVAGSLWLKSMLKKQFRGNA